MNTVHLMNYNDLADLTGIPKATLYRLVHQQVIPHIRLGPRSVRFLFDQFLNGLKPKQFDRARTKLDQVCKCLDAVEAYASGCRAHASSTDFWFQGVKFFKEEITS